MTSNKSDGISNMRPGIYEQIIDCATEGELTRSNLQKITENLDPGDSHAYLSQFVERLLSRGLRMVRGKSASNEKLEQQIAICNAIIQYLNELELEGFEESAVSPLAKRLLALEDSPVRSYRDRPDTPLALGALLTGTRQDPSMVSQLQKEILTADRIDILCSFIKWTGIRVLQDSLERFVAYPGATLRVITTSYMGATDLKAVEFLRALPNTQIKVSYDTRRTRLHAKSYMFHRSSGFNTAYVGSANLSHVALTEGLEWNVKISGYEQPFLWDKVTSTFETYWHDKEFENYQDLDRGRLGEALKSEKGSATDHEVPIFELKPYVFQEEVLENIDVERSLHGRHKHLIVSATGTGKTMLAAFDYQRWRKRAMSENGGREPMFLFVAHREEILKQARYSFRAVLRDQNFGDLLVGNHKSGQIKQLFVSIQSFNSKSLHLTSSPSFYDYIVVDEFHHACAPSYMTLLEHYTPRSLLGLTATPERADGLDITQYFDGHISAEIRLPNAINRKLLCPFQYFGISDSVDYSQVKWSRGGYDCADLDKLLTGDDIRANRIAEKTAETVLDIRRVKGLGFCVSKAHAAFMAKVFNDKGIPSFCLTADSSQDERNGVQKRLRDGHLNFIFVVDLFNEGVDIPAVDTVLFLRPTDSLTVFLQQLGRGLRTDDGKECLTVLDFVGQAHRNFRYDVLFRALLTNDAESLDKELESGFPHLPAGCTINLERKSKDYILENIRRSIASHKTLIIQRIASFEEEAKKPLTLSNFLLFHRLTLDDIYRRATWSRLCQKAGVQKDYQAPDEDLFKKALRRMIHLDDVSYIRDAILWVSGVLKKEESGVVIPKEHLSMLYYSFFPQDREGPGLAGLRNAIRSNTTLARELLDLLQHRLNSVRHAPAKVSVPFPCLLQLHAQYTTAEARAALGHLRLDSRTSFREGVLHLADLPADIFFITLNKTESRYSPTTMYEDYAIDEVLFHWQSQSTTSIKSSTGQRYINHQENGHTIFLFVREHAKVNGRAMPFYFLGPATYQEHHGERPINFTWKLRHPMPADLQMQTERLAVF